MNELGKMIEQMPKEARVVYQVTMELDPQGGVISRAGGNVIAQAIFAEVLDKKLFLDVQDRMNAVCLEVASLMRSHHNSGVAIDMLELKRQVRGEQP